MSSGASGSDEKISATKIDPLASDVKANVPHDQSSRGFVGTDRTIDQARIDPVGGGDRYKHPAPHATSGVIGNDANIDKAKIEPLEGQTPKGGEKPSGLTDEEIDAARVQPLGEVREEM
ncbi:MAG: hypothetical protein LQ338_002875 [Usnochroma carphineum]|nr:MAG: hypothetical protein LQ338_002875 [Usnochroma carphineum]